MSLTIQEVKSKYQQNWLQDPDVVSVGIGLSEDNKPAIILGVRSEASPSSKLPSEIEGFPLLIQNVGTPKAT